MGYKILLAGSGQLGSRYLQGLKESEHALEIDVFDISMASLQLATERWNEVNGEQSRHRVNFFNSLSSLRSFFDICIVATTANSRLQVIKKILEQTKIDHWILEKVLAQSIGELDDLADFLRFSESVHVNTPMHMWSLYQNLKEAIGTKDDLKFFYKDIRGLACNAIHYIDLVSRWNGSTIQNIDTDNLNSKWYEAERKGFWDVYGELKVSFSDGSMLSISSKEKERNFEVEILNGASVWKIDERQGIALSNDGLRIEGNCEYQSKLTARLVSNILSAKKCNLPSLNESIEIHKILISSLLQHWNKSMNQNTEFLPIT